MNTLCFKSQAWSEAADRCLTISIEGCTDRSDELARALRLIAAKLDGSISHADLLDFEADNFPLQFDIHLDVQPIDITADRPARFTPPRS